jgi:hypothetical protein
VLAGVADDDQLPGKGVELGGVGAEGDDDRPPGLAGGPDLLADRHPADRSQGLVHDLADALNHRRVALRAAQGVDVGE